MRAQLPTPEKIGPALLLYGDEAAVGTPVPIIDRLIEQAARGLVVRVHELIRRVLPPQKLL